MSARVRSRSGAAALVAVALAAAPIPSTAQSLAITGGKVYPVSGPPIENGTVLVRDGVIVAVGAGIPIPADAQRVDATGKVVTPGFINASTQLALVEIGAVAGTREATARGKDGIAAAFRPWEGLNPASVMISPARLAGVTSVLVVPRGGLISGQAAMVHLVAGSVTDMVMRAPVAMIATLGAGSGDHAMPRAETIMRLREILDDARVYRARRGEFERAQTRTLAASRVDLEALLPVLDGRVPLVVVASKASDIEAALRLAKEFSLKLIIGDGSEAWQVADQLRAANVPVFTGAMNNIPSGFSYLGTRQENAGLLSKAGVTVGLIGNAGGGDEEAFNVRNIRFEAGNAVTYGMEWNAALRAITLTPAEVFGVADRVGSLSAGKMADIVIWSGDPFEFASQPEKVYVRGQVVTQPSRQEMLEDRYRVLPPNYRRQ